MEEFVVSPPNTLLYIIAGILVVGLASVLLHRGDRRKKITALAVLIVVSAGLLLFLYRPTRIEVDADGVAISGRITEEFTWSQVESALFEPNLPVSEWRPTVRQVGAAIGSYRTGRFLLSNGNPAQLAMERDDSTVILRTADTTYLLAPPDVEALAQAINSYRTIGEEGND